MTNHTNRIFTLSIRKNTYFEDVGDHWIDPNLLYVLNLHPNSKLFFASYQKQFLKTFANHTISLQRQDPHTLKIIQLKGLRATLLQHVLETDIQQYPYIQSSHQQYGCASALVTQKRLHPHPCAPHTLTAKQNAPTHARLLLAPATHNATLCRRIKTATEIQTIRTACQLTCDAIHYVLQNISCYASTREVYHDLHKYICDHHPHNHSAQKRLHLTVKRFDFLAYSTILTVNGNCVDDSGAVDLHPAHHKHVRFANVQSPVLLLDVGVKYRGYCADITRTFPVRTFSPYQQRVYDAVKRLYTLGESMVKPGVFYSDIQDAVVASLRRELRQLGIPDHQNVKKYMPHSLGHSVGLQVHDQPSVTHGGALREGMVLTIEPGIYLPDVCVRIENTIAVTKEGCDVLSGSVKW